jgi:hypothetical protein
MVIRNLQKPHFLVSQKHPGAPTMGHKASFYKSVFFRLFSKTWRVFYLRNFVNGILSMEGGG